MVTSGARPSGDEPNAPHDERDHAAIANAFFAWARAHKVVVQLETELDSISAQGRIDAEREALMQRIATAKLEAQRLLDLALAIVNRRGAK